MMMNKTIPEIFLDASVLIGLVDNLTDKTRKYSDILWKRFTEKPNEFKIILSKRITKEAKDVLKKKKTTTERKLYRQKIKQIKYTNKYVSKKVRLLADEYEKAGILVGKTNKNDRLHIACATIRGCDYLISNNFDDMANSNKMNEINKINLQNGYNEIIIITPYTFIKELELAEQTKTTPKPPYIINATKNREKNDNFVCLRKSTGSV
jgi:predicted nucleic acid-binding protein